MSGPGRRGRIARGSGRFGARLRAFGRAEDGTVVILFSLFLFPILSALGAALDYTRAASLQSQMGRAADAAVLAGLTETKSQISNGADDATAFAAGRAAASRVYATLGSLRGSTAATPTIDIAHVGRTVSVALTATGPSLTMFGRVANGGTMPVTIRAGASGILDPFVDVALLIDVSGSMSIGADPAAMATLQAKLGCAFACHDGTPVNGTRLDAYEWAVSQGIPLRTHAVNTGLVDFLDWLAAQPRSATLYRVSLASFADDLTPLSPFTGNIASVKANLPTTTSAASEYTAATHFAAVMPTFARAVGSAGDGGSAGAAKKLVIIATDGVEDPNRTWTSNVPLRAGVGPFDPAQCEALKRAGASVGVIHTAYVPMPWDWGYAATLGQPSRIGGPGTRVDDVEPQLRRCASAGLYVAANAAGIGEAFRTIFLNFAVNRITD